MLPFGAALASGLYGPKALPHHILGTAYSMFQGVASYTNFLLALYLREESKALRLICARRQVLVHYRGTFAMAVLLILPDVFAVLFSLGHTVFHGALEIGLLIYTVMNVVTAAYYTKEIRALNEHLSRFTKHSGSSSSESVRKINRFMRWLGASAFFMIFASIGMAYYATISFNGYHANYLPWSTLWLVYLSR